MNKPGGYGKISQCITTTKHSKAKTVCIFLGIYCIIRTCLRALRRQGRTDRSKWLSYTLVCFLNSELGYFTVVFQVLLLIALVVFVAMGLSIAPFMSVQFLVDILQFVQLVRNDGWKSFFIMLIYAYCNYIYIIYCQFSFSFFIILLLEEISRFFYKCVSQLCPSISHIVVVITLSNGFDN